MAYEKYIKKDGKIYGPYLYQSKRVDGKVVSEYHGQKKINYKKAILILPFIFLVVLGAYLISNSQKKLTGNAVLNLNANYQEGQMLNGNLKLSVDSGELIPADSNVVFQNGGQTYQYALQNVVSDQAINGSFFVEGQNLSGSGPGFGLPGTKEVYPDVQFALIISSQNQSQINNNTNQQNQENNTGENASSGNTTANSSGLLGVISNFFLSLTPTGHAVVEFQNQVNGNVSAGNPFTYTLQPGETAELEPTSVESGGVQLPDNTVSLVTNGNIVTVSTDYSKEEQGFGADYSGQNKKDLTINLDKLNLSLEKGNLTVSIVYNGQEINSVTTDLESGQVSAIVTKNNTTNPPTENNQPQTNFTTPENNPTENNNINPNQTIVTNINQTLELTPQERTILYNNFGNSTIKATQATEKNGFITVRYELGEYWVENSYSADLDSSTLSLFMQQDRVKFLKDLAQTLSENSNPETNLSGFTGNYSY